MTVSRVFSSLSAVAAAFLALSAAPAHAVTDYITGYIGYFDITQQDHTATQFGLEYRARPVEYGIRPTIGINGTTKGGVYGYAGFHWDVTLLDNRLYLVPNFAAGAYKAGDGKRLGGAIEFRSGIELDYQFENTHRVGIAFNHVSNASIYTHNPGVETLLINYSVPVDVIIPRH